MSIRAKLIGLFGATLIGTLGVATVVAARIGELELLELVRERGLEAARELVVALDDVQLEADPIGDVLDVSLHIHPSIRLGHVLLVPREGKPIEVSLRATPRGFEQESRVPQSLAPARASSRLLREGEERLWEIVLPFARPSASGFVRLLVSLKEAEELVAATYRGLSQVAVVASALLLVATWLLFDRMVGRRLRGISEVMRAVEGGELRREADARGTDEIAHLSRGLNSMLERLRRFNDELKARVAQATTDLARQNRALEEMNEALVTARRDASAKERLAALGQLVGAIAHELGNPLNALNGRLQLALRASPPPPPAIAEELRAASEEVARMTSIIRRFLDSARGLVPVPQEVRVADLVTEAVHLTLGAETQARLVVEQQIDPAAATARLDPGLVRHVLANFVSNAADAMPGGGKLVVRVVRDNGELRLTVEDTGSGLGPEEKKRIFEPFYTTKPGGRGTGLGLTICAEIARAMKGRIDVESAPGRGSAFTLSIPA